MAKKITSTKKVTYRFCPLGSDLGQNLQQLLTSALDNVPKPAMRQELLDTDGNEIRAIGKHFIENGCLCGYLTSWEKGASQPVIEDSPTAPTLRVSALPPPTPKQGEAQKQYVPGVMYFAIFCNHVAFVSTMSLRSNSLEAHLNWLLKTKSELLDKKIPLILSDEVKKATKARIQKSHVKSITFSQPLMSEVAAPLTTNCVTGSETVSTTSTESKFKPTGAMWDMILSAIGKEKDLASLGLDDISDSNFDVWVEIRHPKRQRSKPENAVKFMDTLGVALRDTEGDQVSLELEDGNRISGNDLKISGTVTATLGQNNLFDDQDVLKEISAWLRSQINNGVVDP